MKKIAVKFVMQVACILILYVSFGSGIIIFSGCAVDDQVNLPAKHIHKSDDSGIGKVKLAWKNVPDADSYNLYVSEFPDAKSTGKKIINVLNPITLVDLEVGTTYYFVVTTVDNGVESAPSNEISFYVDD